MLCDIRVIFDANLFVRSALVLEQVFSTTRTSLPVVCSGAYPAVWGMRVSCGLLGFEILSWRSGTIFRTVLLSACGSSKLTDLRRRSSLLAVDEYYHLEHSAFPIFASSIVVTGSSSLSPILLGSALSHVRFGM